MEAAVSIIFGIVGFILEIFGIVGFILEWSLSSFWWAILSGFRGLGFIIAWNETSFWWALLVFFIIALIVTFISIFVSWIASHIRKIRRIKRAQRFRKKVESLLESKDYEKIEQFFLSNPSVLNQNFFNRSLSPLSYAIKESDFKLSEIFVNSGANVLNSNVYEAIEVSNVEILQLLLSQIENISEQNARLERQKLIIYGKNQDSRCIDKYIKDSTVTPEIIEILKKFINSYKTVVAAEEEKKRQLEEAEKEKKRLAKEAENKIINEWLSKDGLTLDGSNNKDLLYRSVRESNVSIFNILSKRVGNIGSIEDSTGLRLIDYAFFNHDTFEFINADTGEKENNRLILEKLKEVSKVDKDTSNTLKDFLDRWILEHKPFSIAGAIEENKSYIIPSLILRCGCFLFPEEASKLDNVANIKDDDTSAVIFRIEILSDVIVKILNAISRFDVDSIEMAIDDLPYEDEKLIQKGTLGQNILAFASDDLANRTMECLGEEKCFTDRSKFSKLGVNSEDYSEIPYNILCILVLFKCGIEYREEYKNNINSRISDLESQAKKLTDGKKYDVLAYYLKIIPKSQKSVWDTVSETVEQVAMGVEIIKSLWK